jgi:hypothetical protein
LDRKLVETDDTDAREVEMTAQYIQAEEVGPVESTGKQEGDTYVISRRESSTGVNQKPNS